MVERGNNQDQDHYDVCVVGAGVMGSATAYHCAKRGQKVLMLEQFEFMHRIGSSHGESRIIRKAYEEDFYVNLAIHGFKAWEEVEAEAKTKLVYQTGGIDLAEKSNNPEVLDSVEQIKSALERFDIEHTPLTREEICKRFPGITVPQGWHGVWEKTAGVINASKSVSTLQALARSLGVVMQDRCQVLDIITGDEHNEDDNKQQKRIKVITSEGEYSCEKIALCPGAWCTELLRKVNVQVEVDPIKVSVGFFERKAPLQNVDEGSDEYGFCKFPTLIIHELLNVEGKPAHGLYALPCFEYPGHLKMAVHSGPTVDLQKRNFTPSAPYMGEVANALRTFMPEMKEEPSITDTCMYTNTTDTRFVIDTHPANENVVICCGFSGHGFKFGAIVGKIVSELVVDGQSKLDIKEFSLSRFKQPI